MLYFGPLNAELVKPSNKLDPYDVVKIQLKALKNNNEKDKRYDIIYILFRIVISFSDKWR